MFEEEFMKKVTRRSFIKTSTAAAALTAATPLLPRGWYRLARADSPGYFEREFGMSDRIYGKVVAKALSKGGDFADLFFEHSVSNWIILEDGKVNRAYSDVSLGVGIRTVKEDQVGYGFTQDLSEESMLKAASTAATIANGTAKSLSGKFVDLKTNNYYPLKSLLTSVSLESKLPLSSQ